MDFLRDPLRNLSYFRPEARYFAGGIMDKFGPVDQQQETQLQTEPDIEHTLRTSSEQRLLGWNVPPHELQYIPEHWLKYPEPPESMNYLLALLYIFFFFMSITGNGLVIYVFCAAKSLRTPSNIFVINLAVCDFFMMSKTPIFIYNSFKCGFALGHTFCDIFALIGAYTGIAAGMTNAFIAYDRFNVITRPMEGKMTQVKAIVILICIYLYTTPLAILPYVRFWGQFVPALNIGDLLKRSSFLFSTKIFRKYKTA